MDCISQLNVLPRLMRFRRCSSASLKCARDPIVRVASAVLLSIFLMACGSQITTHKKVALPISWCPFIDGRQNFPSDLSLGLPNSVGSYPDRWSHPPNYSIVFLLPGDSWKEWTYRNSFLVLIFHDGDITGVNIFDKGDTALGGC